MTYMAQIIITSPQAVGKAKIKAVDTYNYVVSTTSKKRKRLRLYSNSKGYREDYS